MVNIIPKKNKTLAGVFAIFLGTIGIHKFYMGKWKQGLLYLLFFWCGVPTVLGIIDGARLLTQAAEEAPDVDEIENASKAEETDEASEAEEKEETAETEEESEAEEKEEAEAEEESENKEETDADEKETDEEQEESE